MLNHVGNTISMLPLPRITPHIPIVWILCLIGSRSPPLELFSFQDTRHSCILLHSLALRLFHSFSSLNPTSSHANPRLDQIQLQLLRLLGSKKMCETWCIKATKSTEPHTANIYQDEKWMEMHRKQKRLEKTENNSQKQHTNMRKQNFKNFKNFFDSCLTFCRVLPISAAGDLQFLNSGWHWAWQFALRSVFECSDIWRSRSIPVPQLWSVKSVQLCLSDRQSLSKTVESCWQIQWI